MSEIVTIVSLSALALHAIIFGANWIFHVRRAGPRQRALFFRWSVYGVLIIAAVTGWVLIGMTVFLSRSEFWRGAYVGGSAVLWLGYVPALVWAIYTRRRHEAEARAADAGAIV